MDEHEISLDINDVSENIETAKIVVLDWVSKNIPEKVDEVNDKLSSVNLVDNDEHTMFNATENNLYYTKEFSKSDFVHEFVHVMSYRPNSNHLHSRFGISPIFMHNTHKRELNPLNEGLTELSSLIIQKGAKYIIDTDIEDILKIYRDSSHIEQGYFLSNEYLLMKVKESNLDEKQINDLVKSFLFDDKDIEVLINDLSNKLGVENVIDDINIHLDEKGREQLKTAWNYFKNSVPSEFWEKTKVSVGNNKIYIAELIKPFDFGVNFDLLKVWWRVEKYAKFSRNEMYKRHNISSNIPELDGSYLYLLMSNIENPIIQKELNKYFFAEIIDYYKKTSNMEENT